MSIRHTMNLLSKLLEDQNEKARALVYQGLAMVDKHTNLDAIRPFEQKVNVHSKENMVTVHFPLEGTHTGIVTKGGAIERDAVEERKIRTLYAKELLVAMSSLVNIEDSEITTFPKSVMLFMISDDFM